MKRKVSIIGIIVLVVVAMSAVYLKGRYDASNAKGPQLISEAQAAGGKVRSPVLAAPERYVYYPGTEVLGPDEIRVVACGTGMPAARRAQAATCFLVETGNGDKFIFDIGSGAMANLAALMIPYQYLDKVFLTHLHTDHMGDIDSLWAGGWTAGRPNALRGLGSERRPGGHGYKVCHGEFSEARQLGLHDQGRSDLSCARRHRDDRV